MTAVCNAIPARATDASVQVQSHALGVLHVAPSDIRAFPHGLVGFPECRRFALLAIADRTGMYWLQSTDNATLAFLLVDPFVVRDGYAVELSDMDRHDLGVHDPADILILAVVTLAPAPGEPCTANLQGPIAVNIRSGVGKQIVIADPPFGVRTPIDLARCSPVAGR